MHDMILSMSLEGILKSGFHLAGPSKKKQISPFTNKTYPRLKIKLIHENSN